MLEPVKLKAILWDGYSRIHGEINLSEEQLVFQLADFAKTNLEFHLSYSEIKDVKLHTAFDLEKIGIEILTKSETENIFIVENPRETRSLIKDRISTF